MAKSLGERRIRKQYKKLTTDEQNLIDDIKQRGIELTNLIDQAAPQLSVSKEEFSDFKRWQSMAITDIENAVTNAVKMVTA